MSILKSFEKELKKYCANNDLDFEKVVSFPRCGNEQVLFIQRVNRKKKVDSIKKQEPAEVLISATKDGSGKIQFTKGVNADKYLGL